MTSLKEYQEILDDFSKVESDLESLNTKIVNEIGRRYHTVNASKHLQRSKKMIQLQMQNKYGHLMS